MIRQIAIITGLFIVAASSCAYAEGFSTPMISRSTDSRISIVPYDETDIYTLYTKVGYQSSILFGEDEEIQTISVGDRSPWQIIPSGSRLFIRPMVEGLSTNMTLITSKHTYQFDLKSASTTNGQVIYVMKFTYETKSPTFVAATSSMASPTASAPSTPSPFTPPAMPRSYAPAYTQSPNTEKPRPQNANYNYTYSGPDNLAPIQVYDDGISTFVSSRNVDDPLPKTYVVDATGNEQPVPNHLVGDKMVIDTVAGTLALKSSKGTVRIYNETLNPQ
ncbi:MAG: hypothetical protein EBR02_07780 [Alphaproteobacteria bacterium]|nr:hypothetical protein [Alphaproteobacteria bacterium]